jgi:hypothetical protein
MAEINLQNKSDILVYGMKKEFLSIRDKYLFSIATKQLMHELQHEYDKFFIKYGLEDIKFILKIEGFTVSLTPIRNIDRMAIIGILNTPDNIKINVSEEIKDNYINILKQLKK